MPSFSACFDTADWQSLLPLPHKILISQLLVLAIFRPMCHFPARVNTVLAGHARKGQTVPRMSGPSLGRQTQTRLRQNFEEKKNSLRMSPGGPSPGPNSLPLGPPGDMRQENSFFPSKLHLMRVCVCLPREGPLILGPDCPFRS